MPQGSIDRTKAIDLTKPNEVRAGPTAFARRSLSTPIAEQTQVDTQLTSARSALPAADASATYLSTPDTSVPAATAVAATTLAASSMLATEMPAQETPDSEIDAAVAAFDVGARPARTVSTNSAVLEPTPNFVAAARPQALQADPPDSASRNTVRIRVTAEDAFADADEPAERTASGGAARLAHHGRHSARPRRFPFA